MEKVKVEIEVPKNTYELAKGLGEFAVAVKQALADGWQVGQDLPVILTSAMTSLVPHIGKVAEVDDDAKADPLGMGQALVEGLKPVFKRAM